jgi:uncharacterized protein (TIGR02246 family)
MTPAETKREMVRRMRAKHLDGVMALIADDAVYFWSNGSAMFGKAEIAEAMQTNFATILDDTYDVHDLTWIAEDDDIAACVFRFEWTGKINGQPVSGQGRGVTVLKRIDGEWRVAHENLSQGRWRHP